MSTRTGLLTLAIVALYASIMFVTNSHFTILDDESTIVAVAGHPVLPTIKLFLSGGDQNEHPPLSDIALHGWLVATHYSFFFLRVFANMFFIAGMLCLSFAARRLAGPRAYWSVLLLGFVWPFAFQYGRITGWYCFCMFVVSALIWAYVELLEDKHIWSWAAFAVAALLLVWSNYFSVVILALLFIDFLLFHRRVASRQMRLFTIVSVVIAASFLPLAQIAISNLPTSQPTSQVHWSNAFAILAYPAFAIFASAAVAPWFLPLSIPVALSACALVVSIWFSPGLRWFFYFVLAIILLDLTGHKNIKRVLFLLPYLFLAMGLASASRASRYPKLAWAAIAILVTAGWIGIASGRHYATTNLYEPWDQVAQVVANDARSGATIISASRPFLFYLDYQLGLEADTQEADGPYLGEAVYRAHGYKILQPDEGETWGDNLRGKVALVNGSGQQADIAAGEALNDRLRLRCRTLGKFVAAPDPAASWKTEFVKGAPVLPYRVNAFWYDCSNSAK